MRAPLRVLPPAAIEDDPYEEAPWTAVIASLAVSVVILVFCAIVVGLVVVNTLALAWTR